MYMQERRLAGHAHAQMHASVCLRGLGRLRRAGRLVAQPLAVHEVSVQQQLVLVLEGGRALWAAACEPLAGVPPQLMQ